MSRFSVRIRAAWAGLLVLALVLGFSTTRPTEAVWTSNDRASGSFGALDLEWDPSSFSCADTRNALLGLGNRELLLQWAPPTAATTGVPVTYDISWNGGLLGESGSTTTTVPRHLYRAGSALLGVSVLFSITPRIGNWRGETLQYRAANITALGIFVRIECETLLGIL